MAVLVAYEESGKVTAALRAQGIEAFSNDLEDTRGNPDWHIKGDAMEVIFSRQWDGIIAHPVCTRMTNSSNKHLYMGMNKENGVNHVRWAQMEKDANEFAYIYKNAPTACLVMENPIMHCHAREIILDRTGLSKDSAYQVIQPWMFGHEEIKATCLWPKGLPFLKPTKIVGPPPLDVIEKRKWAKVHRCPPGPLRSRIRSETLQGIADALAEQYAPYFKGEKSCG
jgi:hypothetical protein